MDTTAKTRVPAPRSGSDTTERSAAALGGFWRGVAAVALHGSYDETRGVARLRTGVPVPAFNGVFGFGAAVDGADVLAAVDDFATGDLPWNVQLRPGYPPQLDAALADRGLVATEQIPLMVLADPSALPPAGDVVVRPVASYRELDTTLTLLEQGFEMPAALTREAFPVAALFMPGTTSWIASADGVDVSTAFGVVQDGTCGIFNVATPAEHRGKGYGGTVTAAAVRAALEAGADIAYLQSSALGYRVYERLGFVTAERWTQWMPHEYVEDAPAH